ncbi:hypothetical protein NDU88_002926 [Pleurodeles waltl]|uniref:Uncharacterized protein n=1 Tax=Pleurodeles waltl TaxID=8319 RepID=A0AAV7VFR5_PLEWA|nr:hypothetical protein NDU88_002926 [Pleurodeles waltl]
MPSGKATGISSGKQAQQLLFSEAVQLTRPASSAAGPNPPAQPPTISDTEQTKTMERILQEISAVSRRLEGMDTVTTSLITETKSMHLDIAGFKSRVTGLEHRVVTLETHIHTVQDRDKDLMYLCSKLTDLDDI